MHLTHLRVSKRTPCQHLSSSPPTFPTTQNVPFHPRFRLPWLYAGTRYGLVKIKWQRKNFGINTLYNNNRDLYSAIVPRIPHTKLPCGCDTNKYYTQCREWITKHKNSQKFPSFAPDPIVYCTYLFFEKNTHCTKLYFEFDCLDCCSPIFAPRTKKSFPRLWTSPQQEKQDE